MDLIALPRDGAVTARERSDLFGGSTVIVADGAVNRVDDWDGALYRNAPARREPCPLTAIPYYLWNNREPGPMTVWIPET
jgi:DUF1680 family protein